MKGTNFVAKTTSKSNYLLREISRYPKIAVVVGIFFGQLDERLTDGGETFPVSCRRGIVPAVRTGCRHFAGMIIGFRLSALACGLVCSALGFFMVRAFVVTGFVFRLPKDVEVEELCCEPR